MGYPYTCMLVSHIAHDSCISSVYTIIHVCIILWFPLRAILCSLCTCSHAVCYNTYNGIATSITGVSGKVCKFICWRRDAADTSNEWPLSECRSLQNDYVTQSAYHHIIKWGPSETSWPLSSTHSIYAMVNLHPCWMTTSLGPPQSLNLINWFIYLNDTCTYTVRS